MKRYVFEIIIEEGNDDFWEELNANNKSGCDEVTEMLQEMLDSTGFVEARLTLKQFYNV